MTPAPSAPFPALVSGSALSVLVVAGLVLAPTAEADPGGVPARPGSTLGLEPLGTYAGGGFDESAAEIPAFDAATDRIFVVNAERGTVDVLDASDPTDPRKVGELDTPGANSVDVERGVLAVAEAADPATEPGTVAFFDTTSLEGLGRVTVGALPDMLTFSPDGRHLLVANEGEPEGYLPGQADPEGSVSVISVPRRGVPTQADVRTAGFASFDDDVDDLRAAGVRVFGPGASLSQDLEPEYVAVDHLSRTAWVSLQENNALAVVDIASASVTDLLPLGLKDHSLPGNGLDASDRDGAIAIGAWPVSGMYMPDAIDSYRARGRTYLVLANEGDAREYDGFEEEVRIEDLDLDPDVFGGTDGVAALQQRGALGRLTSTTTSPTNEQGLVTRIDVFGARSFSIRDTAGRVVFDSGDDFEGVIADLVAAGELPRDAFNADNAENDSFDTRSDNKGPEPEGIEIGSVAGRTYAFVGLERVGGIMVYDITVPTAASFVDYVNVRDLTGDLEANGSDSGPEGLVFVEAKRSPTGEPLLVVGNEVSGTTTVYAVTGR